MSGISLSPEDEHHLSLSLINQAAAEREELRTLFDEQERTIANLERENRKLTDKLNRFRNVLPGRKRLITLGRIAAHMEHETDLDEEVKGLAESKFGPTFESDKPIMKRWRKDIANDRADALFLRRLEWDFEQAIDVVWEPKQARHEWPRP